MSLSDVVDAVSLAEKGLLSPQSFQKVVSRIVRGTDAKEPCKSGAKVVCPDAPYIDVFLTGVCSCNLLLRLVEGGVEGERQALRFRCTKRAQGALSVHRVSVDAVHVETIALDLSHGEERHPQ